MSAHTKIFIIDAAHPIAGALGDFLERLQRDAVARSQATPPATILDDEADASHAKIGADPADAPALSRFVFGNPAERNPAPKTPLPPTQTEVWAAAEADKRAAMTAAEICDALATNPKLKDVATFLLRPLVDAGLVFDGNVEATLTRRANEFCDYRRPHLACASIHLITGKHRHFPEADEIYAALGRVARPGYVARNLDAREAK